MKVGKIHPSQEDEAQKAVKQAKVRQKCAKKRSDPQVAPLAWTPTLMLDRAPLPASASIRDFQRGMASYMADMMEQALLLLEDMAELSSMRKHKVFLSLKRYLAMVCTPLSPPPPFLLFSSLSFSNLSLSLASYSSLLPGEEVNQLLPSANERGGRKVQRCCREGSKLGQARGIRRRSDRDRRGPQG